MPRKVPARVTSTREARLKRRKRAQETPEERAQRLRTGAEYQRRKRAVETEEERVARLVRNKEGAKKRRACEAQKRKRLEKMETAAREGPEQEQTQENVRMAMTRNRNLNMELLARVRGSLPASEDESVREILPV